MVDPAFDDFLESDDDAYFLEASNHLLDKDFNLDFTSTRKENVLENATEISTNNYFKPAIEPSQDKLDIADISTKSSSACENVDKNVTVTTVFSSSDNHQNDKTFNEFENYVDKSTSQEISHIFNKAEICISSLNVCKSINKDEAAATTSPDCNKSIEDVNLSKVTPANSSYINKRFTPGFTPMAKKGKFPGPAGFLEFLNKSKEEAPNSPDKLVCMDMEFQNILGSQYTPEHLSLPSWRKLQTTVSSCPNLLSNAKYYSIQRILKESSKKKLPKHMIVPVLCVLLKEFSKRDSAVIPIFMDDTGEINGKIDAELLLKNKEFFVEGAALILKKVTLLCNLLILKDQNLVSLYHPQGTEKHLQSLESIQETSEPLKPMNCGCLKLSHLKKDTPYHDSSNHHTSKCVTYSQNRLNNISYKSKGKNYISQNNTTPNKYKSGFTNSIQNRSKDIMNQNNSVNKSAANTVPKQSTSVDETFVDSQTMRSDKFFEQLLDGDDCMDEFDDILGNLDEKTFMEEM